MTARTALVVFCSSALIAPALPADAPGLPPTAPPRPPDGPIRSDPIRSAPDRSETADTGPGPEPRVRRHPDRPAAGCRPAESVLARDQRLAPVRDAAGSELLADFHGDGARLHALAVHAERA